MFEEKNLNVNQCLCVFKWLNIVCRNKKKKTGVNNSNLLSPRSMFADVLQMVLPWM